MYFLRNNWIYILVAFGIVFLVGIGYVTYTRLDQLGERKPIVTAPSATPPEQPVSEVELTFQITPTEREITGLSCIELLGSPLQGEVSLEVDLTGLAADLTESISFVFDFGDGSSETLQTDVDASTHNAVQSVKHTYTQSGAYVASLTVSNDTEEKTSAGCSVNIAAGVTADTSPVPSTIIPTVNPTLIASAPTSTPTPSVSTSITPSITTQPVGGNSFTPTPTDAVAVPNVPEAGTFLPTVLAIIGGFFIILIAFALL